LVADKDEVGVPVIAPVDVLMARPEGSEGEIARVIGDVPPLAVTGVNDVAAALAVSVSDAIANVVESAAETASEKVFVAVTDAASVTVTV
jgi:hypothetical protein